MTSSRVTGKLMVLSSQATSSTTTDSLSHPCSTCFVATASVQINCTDLLIISHGGCWWNFHIDVKMLEKWLAFGRNPMQGNFLAEAETDWNSRCREHEQ